MSTDFNEHKQIKSALLLCKSRVGTTISNIPNIAIHQAFTQPWHSITAENMLQNLIS